VCMPVLVMAAFGVIAEGNATSAPQQSQSPIRL
jgi:hypothetical protein